MDRRIDETHLSPNQARGGVTNHGVRYVLLISTLLAIVALSAVWIIGTFAN
ncbi:MAG: hypothetical protein ACKOUM_11180 [Sphingopyxis sp.]